MKLPAWLSPAISLAIFAGLLGSNAATTWAQPVGIAPPAPTTVPASLQAADPALDAGLTTQATAPIQWGFISVRPHALYRLTRGDGLQSGPGSQNTTTISTLSPGLLFEIGRRWTADYTATWTTYTSDAFRDTVEHALSLLGAAAFTNGSITLNQTYALSDSPRIETGRQTKEESVGTSVTVNYSLGQKTGIEWQVGRTARNVELAPDSTDWSTQGWFMYQLAQRLNGGIGVAYGYTSVDPGVDMSYFRPQVRLGYRPTEKLTVDAHYGREYRKFHKPGAADMESPNYGLAGFYRPVPTTSLSLSLDRSVSVSYFADVVNESESVTLGISQRLLQRFYFNASANRTNTDYLPAGAKAINVIRNDTSTGYNLRLSTAFLRRGTVGLVYSRTRNSTNAAGYGFASKQIGLEVGYRY